MGTSQQPEPKLGTGPQLKPDSEPELTPKLIAWNFRFFIFSKIKNKKIQVWKLFFSSSWLGLDMLLVSKKKWGLE